MRLFSYKSIQNSKIYRLEGKKSTFVTSKIVKIYLKIFEVINSGIVVLNAEIRTAGKQKMDDLAVIGSSLNRKLILVDGINSKFHSFVGL